MNESDAGKQDYTHFRVALGFSVSSAIILGAGEFLWIIGNIRLPKGTSETYEPPLMAVRLFSYALGFGIPLLQEFLIRTIYFKVKGETMAMFWIPACGS